ncbi:MAG: hypothetical protein NVS3B25_10200 [Hymenobacter sp.]
MRPSGAAATTRRACRNATARTTSPRATNCAASSDAQAGRWTRWEAWVGLFYTSDAADDAKRV